MFALWKTIKRLKIVKIIQKFKLFGKIQFLFLFAKEVLFLFVFFAMNCLVKNRKIDYYQ